MASKKPLTRPKALGRHLNFAAGASTTMCNEMLAEFDLSLPQWVILSALWRRDGLLLTELADYTGNNAPATSRIIDRMVDRDLVRREAVEGDRRAVRVCLAERGRGLDHLALFFERVNEQLLQGLSDTEAETLFALLTRVEANARGWRSGADKKDD